MSRLLPGGSLAPRPMLLRITINERIACRRPPIHHDSRTHKVLSLHSTWHEICAKHLK